MSRPDLPLQQAGCECVRSHAAQHTAAGLYPRAEGRGSALAQHGSGAVPSGLASTTP